MNLERVLNMGIISEERELHELGEMVSVVASALNISNKNDFANGFVEGRIFQTVYFVMRLINFGISKEDVLELTKVSEDIYEGILECYNESEEQ